MGSYFQSKTDKIETTIEFCIFELAFDQISLWKNNSEFLGQIYPRKIFMVQNRKIEHRHWILLIQISLGIKFQLKLLNWQFGFFWPDLPKKVLCGVKEKRWPPPIFYIILHAQIILMPNFSSKWQFLFFESNFQKVFVVKNWKR